MNENHLDFILMEISEIARAAANQIVDFAGHLRSAESPADNDECQMPFAPLAIRADLGPLQLLDQMRAKGGGVTDGLERERMVGHSGNNVEIGCAAARNHHVIEGKSR